jgi:hypothetical protein
MGRGLPRDVEGLVWGFRAQRLIILRMADLSNLRILAADDHPLIPAGLVSYLETEPGLKVVAEAGTARRRSRNIGSCGRTSS